MNRKGFTVVELIVVAVIVAVLFVTIFGHGSTPTGY